MALTKAISINDYSLPISDNYLIILLMMLIIKQISLTEMRIQLMWMLSLLLKMLITVTLQLIISALFDVILSKS